MRTASALFALFAAALSASAFQVTSPNNSTSWAASGSNTLTWSRVSTDATSFTVVLTNTDRSVMPVNDQTLATNVDASSASSLVIAVPSGGFNPGPTYRVDLISTDPTNSGILAQSDEFTIVAGSSSASGSMTVSVSSSASGSASASGSSGSGTTLTLASSGTGSSASGAPAGASGSSSGLNPSTTSNAAVPRAVEFGFLGAMLALGGILA